MNDEKSTQKENANNFIKKIEERSKKLLHTAWYCMIGTLLLLLSPVIFTVWPRIGEICHLETNISPVDRSIVIGLLVFTSVMLHITYRFKVRLRYYLLSQIDTLDLMKKETIQTKEEVENFTKLLSALTPAWAYKIDKPKMEIGKNKIATT